MQDPEDNKVTLNEIESKVRENLESVFAKNLSEISPQLENLRGIQELESWYEKSGKQGNILEGILEDIANETMKYLPQQYANLSIDVIKLNSKDKKPHVKFSVTFQPEPIRSFVEFAIKVNKIRKKVGRFVFETNATVEIRDMEIFPASRDTKISLGVISGQIQISLVEIPFMEIDDPIEIMTKEIEIDLSGYHIKSSK